MCGKRSGKGKEKEYLKFNVIVVGKPDTHGINTNVASLQILPHFSYKETLKSHTVHIHINLKLHTKYVITCPRNCKQNKQCPYTPTNS